MSLSVNSNYFEVFDLPVAFSIDSGRLRDSYRNLQKQYHPDRFVNEEPSARLQAVQIAAHVNEAHNTLLDPLSRAKYLVGLAHDSSLDDQATNADREFLMTQMELRERLEEVPEAADPLGAVDLMRKELSAAMGSLFQEFESAFSAKDYPFSEVLVTRLQFYQRLMSSLKDTEARLEDELF